MALNSVLKTQSWSEQRMVPYDPHGSLWSSSVLWFCVSLKRRAGPTCRRGLPLLPVLANCVGGGVFEGFSRLLSYCWVGVIEFYTNETLLGLFNFMFLVSLWKSLGKRQRRDLHDPEVQDTITSNSDCSCDAGIVNVTEIFKWWVILGYFYGKIMISPDFQLTEILDSLKC